MSMISNGQGSFISDTTTVNDNTQSIDDVLLEIAESNNNKSIDNILAEIDQIDVKTIQLRPATLKYFQKVQAYLKCFDELERLYNELDPSKTLANFDGMPDIKRPVQQLAMSGAPIKNLTELYEVAEVMLPVFENTIEGLLARTKTGYNSSEYALFKLPPGENKLKERQRASEKAYDDYADKEPGPPESWLYDIVRGSVLFDNAEQILSFLELIRAEESIEIVKSKNRFRNPTLSGYRDWNLQLQISTRDADGSGSVKHICELQLHLMAIKEADVRLGSHSHYEFFRKYYSGATDALKERMDDLRVICDRGSLNTAFLNNVIQNPLEADRMKRLANLFEHQVNDYQLAIMITNATRESLEPPFLYNRMGSLFWKQGKLGDALAMNLKVLELRLEALGPDHMGMSQSYNNLAIVLNDQGKPELALKMYQMTLDIELKALGPDHEDVADTYYNMAIVLRRQGKQDDALLMYQKALDIRLKALGPDHVDVAASYNNMANALLNQDKLEEALAMHQKALDIRLRALGPDNVQVTMSYKNMAIVLRRQEKVAEALEIYQKVVDRQVKALGPDHVAVAASYNEMADMYSEMADALEDDDKSEEALKMLQKVLDIRLKTGPDHEDVVDTYNNMGRLLKYLGKWEEALTVFQKVLNLRLEALGPDHEDLEDSYSSLAGVLQTLGRLEEALAMIQKVMDIQLNELGPDDVILAETYIWMASVLSDQGKYSKALTMQQKALDIRLKELGPDHEDTVESRKLVDLLCSKHKQSDGK